MPLVILSSVALILIMVAAGITRDIQRLQDRVCALEGGTVVETGGLLPNYNKCDQKK